MTTRPAQTPPLHSARRSAQNSPPRGAQVANLGHEHALYINGLWRRSPEKSFEVFDPSTGETLAALPCAGREETLMAVDAAQHALRQWSRRSPLERADCLRRIADLITHYREPLAQLAVLEQGLPLAASRGGVDYAATFFRWYGEEARRIYGRTIAHPDPARRLMVEYSPRGVAGVITPWNAPLSSPAKKTAAALAAGCTVVLKPSELTPLSALALAWLGEQAGLPQGALNVVCGDAPAIGKVFVTSAEVRTLSFTGSVRTGRRLYAAAARRIKHCTLELGGNAPYIIFDDADVHRAVAELVWLKQANSGQICVTANRVLVHESLMDAVADQLVEQYGGLLVGDGFGPGVQQGPLITSNAVDRVDALVQAALVDGAKALCGARRSTLGPNFYAPTVLRHAPPQSRILHDEIFGPALPLVSFMSDDEVIAEANRTQNRLAAFACTSSLARAERCARELNFGVVGINDPRPVTCEAPFGGWCESGVGHEGGSEGLHDFLDAKLVGVRS